MLPRDLLKRFLHTLQQVSAHAGETPPNQDMNNGAHPMDIGQLDNANEDDEHVNAAQRLQRQRPEQKSRSESDNERKSSNRQAAVPTPPTPRQPTPRDRKPGSEETKQNALKTRLLVCYKLGGKGHPARLGPSADDCQDVDEVGTEQSSDADTDLFGRDHGDDPDVSINPRSQPEGPSSALQTVVGVRRFWRV